MHPFAKGPDTAVGALGEERLIAAIRRWLGSASPRAPFGIGDDCAVLPAAAGRQLITVDPVIYGRHFDDTIGPRKVGAKLLKRNLSDLAAMGGQPTAAVLALTVDARVEVRWLEAFYRGLAACARHYAVPIVGGDVAQADGVLAASLTLLGRAAAGRNARVISRRGAVAGDWIYVTGVVGGSVASGHHYSFKPRLAEGAWLSQQQVVRAMMDVSDGLAKDLHALTPSGTKPALRAEWLPQRAGTSLRAALSEGEDYELVFAVAANVDRAAFERAWRRKFRTRLSCIGQFMRVRDWPAGAIDLAPYRGYEHLSGA